MDAAQSILRKTPPADLEKNLKACHELLKDNPDATEALTKRFVLPFAVLDVEDAGERPFLLCPNNAVGDQHRSPWTNHLYPKEEEAGDKAEPQQVDELRELEGRVNEVWAAYKNMYYGNEAVGSVYLHDTDKGAFGGLFGVSKTVSKGSWNSVHIVHVDDPGEKTCNYKVESSVLLVLEPEAGGKDSPTELDISASISKEASKTCKISQTFLAASHIENIGKIIEQNEIDLRSRLERVDIPKTQEIVDVLQKQNEANMHPAVNPLMGMIMESELLKKKLAKEKEQDASETQDDQVEQAKESEPIMESPKPTKKGIPAGGVNPLMGMVLDSSVLKKKLATQKEQEESNS